MLSIILPIKDEHGNVEPLLAELAPVLAPYPDAEVVAVDDGSTDGTIEELKRLTGKYRFLRVLVLSRNYGQTAAIAAGMEKARGDILMPMDADGQNDPRDIPKFLQKLDEGYDIVSGWRRNRHDAWLRSWLSRRANSLIRRASGQEIHDYGCSMKAYRRSAIEHLSLYGDMHRFLAAYAAVHGARVAEIETNHRARTRGTSKYGFGRVWKVLLDLFFLNFFLHSLTRPMHFFGGIGLWSVLLGFMTIVGAVLWRFSGGPTLIQTPLPVLSALFVIIGVQCVLMGVLGEVVVRTYFKVNPGHSYLVRQEFPSS